MNTAFPKPLIVLGAGGLAKVLISALQRAGAEILGLTDPDPAKHGTRVLDVPVLGDDAVIETHVPDSVLLVNGQGMVGASGARRALYARMSAKGYRFATLVDPLAHIAGPVEIGEGAQVLAGAVVQPGTRIGIDSLVNFRAAIDHDCVIGAHAHIAPGVTLSGHVHIGDDTQIGTGASVIQNIHIGANSIIGAGAAVVRDIPDNVIAVGVPARILRRHE